MTEQNMVEQSSPLSRDEIKENLSNLLTGILGHTDREARKSHLYAALVKDGKIFKDPDTFFFTRTYDQKLATKAALKTVKELTNENSEDYCHVFLNYSFYESHIERLCTDFEGSFGCADKSRTIVGRYLAYLRTGEKGKWESGEKGCYWLPTFGTQDEWFEYMKGLHFLYYGQTPRYLNAYQRLVELGKEVRDRLLAEQQVRKAQREQEQQQAQATDKDNNV